MFLIKGEPQMKHLHPGVDPVSVESRHLRGRDGCIERSGVDA
jgi:hypothetical protein